METVLEIDSATLHQSEFDVHRVARILESIVTESGRKFMDLAQESPILLVFLRHGGCTLQNE